MHPDLIKLVKNLLAVCVLVCILSFGVMLFSAQNSNAFMAAGQDKYRILEATKSPKIIMVGGSNLAFSVNSEKIEDHFGVPVVNMGLHVSVGLRFMLKEVEPYLGEGDIVLVFPEYGLFYNDFLDGSPETLGRLIKYCLECIKGLSTSRQYFYSMTGAMDSVEQDLFGVFYKWRFPGTELMTAYSRSGFDRHGDQISHLDFEGGSLVPPTMGPGAILDFNPTALRIMNEFNDYSIRSNATAFLMFPGVPVTSYTPQQTENYRGLFDTLTAGLKMKILGSPQDFVFPESYFFDTPYHMNRIGRDARTEIIIRLLEQALSDRNH